MAISWLFLYQCQPYSWHNAWLVVVHLSGSFCTSNGSPSKLRLERSVTMRLQSSMVQTTRRTPWVSTVAQTFPRTSPRPLTASLSILSPTNPLHPLASSPGTRLSPNPALRRKAWWHLEVRVATVDWCSMLFCSNKWYAYDRRETGCRVIRIDYTVVFWWWCKCMCVREGKWIERSACIAEIAGSSLYCVKSSNRSFANNCSAP